MKSLVKGKDKVIIRLLIGFETQLDKIYINNENIVENKVKINFSDSKYDEKYSEIEPILGEDIELIDKSKEIYDYVILQKILKDSNSISESKVKSYAKYKEDLSKVKYFIKKYFSIEDYKLIFSSKDYRKKVLEIKNRSEKIEKELKERTQKNSNLEIDKIKIAGENEDLEKRVLAAKTENKRHIAEKNIVESEFNKINEEKQTFEIQKSENEKQKLEKELKIQKLNEKTEELRKEYSGINKQKNEISYKLQNFEVKQKAISDAIEKNETFNRSIKHILNEKIDGVIGAFVNLIDVPAGFEEAVQTLSGGMFQDIVVKDSEIGKKCIEILKDKDTELHKVIVEEFSEQFLERLIKIISKKGLREEKNPIFTLISQLVSSQMDADRMDYLLRDSYFTSVTNGNYDLERLIRSFEVVEREGKYIICVNEKYISSIEEYILARFYMHREVYQHSLKRQMESIIKKIFQRGAQLYRENRLSFCDKSMAKLLLGEEISLKEYLGMDDTILMYHMMRWEHEDDTILKKLCYSFLHRRKFYKNKIKKFGWQIRLIGNGQWFF